MFLQTSEKLAGRFPALEPAIAEIDATVAKGGNPFIVADVIAEVSNQPPSTVESALRQFVTEGTLKEHPCFRCKGDDCGQLNEPEEGGGRPVECSACEKTRFHSTTVSTYRLTEKGREERERMSAGLGSGELPRTVDECKGKVDVVVLTMRADEFAAVLKRFPSQRTVEGERRSYNLCLTWSPSANRNFLVATMRAAGQGTGEAQAATSDAMEDLEPGLLLLVGIAGGAPGQATLGDVVFGTYVHDLTVQAVDAGGKRSFALGGGEMDAEVNKLVANLQVTLPPHLGSLELPALPEIDYRAKMMGSPGVVKKAKKLLLDRYGATPKAPAHPTYVFGPVASSDTRVQDAELFELWALTMRNVLCVEMELAGAYRAAKRFSRSVLTIRSISDVVGLSRAEEWTAYAAEAAAAFALAFLRSLQRRPGRKDSQEEEETP